MFNNIGHTILFAIVLSMQWEQSLYSFSAHDGLEFQQHVAEDILANIDVKDLLCVPFHTPLDSFEPMQFSQGNCYNQLSNIGDSSPKSCNAFESNYMSQSHCYQLNGVFCENGSLGDTWYNQSMVGSFHSVEHGFVSQNATNATNDTPDTTIHHDTNCERADQSSLPLGKTNADKCKKYRMRK